MQLKDGDDEKEEEEDTEELNLETQEETVRESEYQYIRQLLFKAKNLLLHKNFEFFIQQRIKFEQEALEAHNRYRALHGAPKMTLNRELCNMAQKWADHLAAEKVFKHTRFEELWCSKGGTGENLHWRGEHRRRGYEWCHRGWQLVLWNKGLRLW